MKKIYITLGLWAVAIIMVIINHFATNEIGILMCFLSVFVFVGAFTTTGILISENWDD